jgi:Bacteriocin-protection, YdeI or OmpD-Associated
LAGAKRVEGEINEHPVNLAPARAPDVEGAFLWTGQSLLDRIGLTVGETVEVRLRPAPSDTVDLPDDVAHALRAADLTDASQALTPGRRRGMLYQVASARTEATRAKRIGKLLEGLA